MKSADAYILGGSGFTAGELLRILHNHGGVNVRQVVSSSSAGKPVGEVHPHLAAAYPDLRMSSWNTGPASLEPETGTAIVVSALPHGASAERVKSFTNTFSDDIDVRVVDLSADYRFRSADDFATIYGTPHPCPHEIDRYICCVPEHKNGSVPQRVAHPGCFTTSVVLATAPIVAAGVAGDFYVSAVTGSTGSGREPRPTTHHPVRANNTFAYKPLKHRHQAEMMMLLGGLSGNHVDVKFAPQSGAFARGIYATIFASNAGSVSKQQVLDILRKYYSGSPFVSILDAPPALKNVVGTNNCHIGVEADDDTIVVFSAIDNLVKGSSGGAVQWINIMLRLDETTGLDSPGLGWL